MALHKSKKNAAKAEKTNFFSQKTLTKLKEEQVFPTCGKGEAEDSAQIPNIEASTDSEHITKHYLMQALDMLSQKLITTWQHSMDSLRKDVQDLSKQTSHMESNMDDYAAEHNDLAQHVEQLEHKLEATEAKLANLEDRSRRNFFLLR
ncbi:Hypothetical predicted protein [Pelobates cultripes]|uniref:Uncharacterized protein n=1 Tax=Pelobates cultripes TaxID=61616 RepID=A0AAD1S031_PELCU|nr:Hypothetical predicted protein [Pelobates cultripes]